MPKVLKMVFWDVQHGNATHIFTPNNRVIVIDLGDGEGLVGNTRFSPLSFLRYSLGVKAIDALIITHPHRDHIDDIDNLSFFFTKSMHRPKWLTEDQVRQGNRQQDTAKISQYLQFSATFTEPLARPNDTNVPNDWGGVVMTQYWSANVPTANLNNHSLVTFLNFAGLKALIPGDNESPSWNALLQNATFKAELSNVDVLLAPHHGREAGYCSDLFDGGLNPRLTVISDDQSGSTSVTAKYGAKTRGWAVYGPTGLSEDRLCVTTRCDGTITVQFGLNDDGTNFLNVVTEK